MKYPPSSFQPNAILTFALAACAALSPAAAQSTVSQIRSAIDEKDRVTLAGNVRPEAKAKNDLGAVDDSLAMEHMQLLLARSDAKQAALDAYTASLNDKSSANYHKWLTPDQFGSRYGVSQADIDTVSEWLAAHGFTVNHVYPNRMMIDFSGTAADVREAFSTEMHHYSVKGVQHLANASSPQIPAALSGVVAGITALHDFHPHALKKARPDYTFTYGGDTYYAVTPADLATIYNLSAAFKAGYTGKGQTIVVIEDTDVYSTADWTRFRKVFGLSGYTSGSFTQVHPKPKSGTNNCTAPGVNSDDGEAILDAEYASAAAPNAAIELAACKDTTTTFGGQIALQNLLNASSKPPALVSISYGDCEADMGATMNAAFKTLYQQAASEGVSVFVSSGDEDSASCDAGDASDTTAKYGLSVSGMASTAYNVAVGGTDFADSYNKNNSTYWSSSNTSSFGSAKSYIPEIPWNNSCASTLLAKYSGYSTTYGKSGFCNSSTGQNYLSFIGGSGGASSCATGKATTSLVTSGTCKGWAKPSWQSVYGNPSDGVRDIPDVSLFAANGVWGHYFPYCYSDIHNGGSSCVRDPYTWSGAGGTSFSAPIMAGIQALVNQKWGRQGNPNPIYYKIAKSEYGSAGSTACNSTKGKSVGSSCVFYDVTLGDIDANCTGTHNCYRPSGTYGVLSTSTTSYAPAYPAKTGWDFATGIGTVNAYNLVVNTNW